MANSLDSIDRKMQQVEQRFEEIKTLLGQAEFGEAVPQERLEQLIEFLANGLRSSLDWLAARGWEKYGECGDGRLKAGRLTPPKWLYFPIRDTKAKFDAAMQGGFPKLSIASGMYATWQHVQPYNGHDGAWLNHLHELNNFIKHVDAKAPQAQAQQMRMLSTQDGIPLWVGRPNQSIHINNSTIGGVHVESASVTPDGVSVTPNLRVLSYVSYTYQFEDSQQRVDVVLRRYVDRVKFVISGSRSDL